MSLGRLFHMLIPATEKVRVPTVDNLTGGMRRRRPLPPRFLAVGRSSPRPLFSQCMVSSDGMSLWRLLCRVAQKQFPFYLCIRIVVMYDVIRWMWCTHELSFRTEKASASEHIRYMQHFYCTVRFMIYNTDSRSVTCCGRTLDLCLLWCIAEF